MVWREKYPLPTPETHVPILIAKNPEFLHREIPFGEQLPRPPTRQLHGQLLRKFPSPAFQVGSEEFFAFLCLITATLVLFIVGTTTLICFFVLLANVEMAVSHLRMTIKLAESF